MNKRNNKKRKGLPELNGYKDNGPSKLPLLAPTTHTPLAVHLAHRRLIVVPFCTLWKQTLVVRSTSRTTKASHLFHYLGRLILPNPVPIEICTRNSNCKGAKEVAPGALNGRKLRKTKFSINFLHNNGASNGNILPLFHGNFQFDFDEFKGGNFFSCLEIILNFYLQLPTGLTLFQFLSCSSSPSFSFLFFISSLFLVHLVSRSCHLETIA